MSDIQKPLIYDFLDAAQFLKSWADYKKTIDPKFSLSQWAKELGFESSATIRFILQRRRNISARTSKVFMVNLALDEMESDYLHHLINYSQAQTITQRKAHGDYLIKIQRQRFQQTRIPAAAASRNVFGPIILTLLTFEDIEKTAANISKLTGLDEMQSTQILEDLAMDGLVKKEIDKTFSFASKCFTIPNDPGLKKYYEYWLERAKQALNLPQHTRKYRSLKFALSEQELNEVVETLNEQAISLLSRYHGNSFTGRKLYMFETALFPILIQNELENKSISQINSNIET